MMNICWKWENIYIFLLSYFLLIIIRDYKKSTYTFNYTTIKEMQKNFDYFYTCQSKKSSIVSF